MSSTSGLCRVERQRFEAQSVRDFLQYQFYLALYEFALFFSTRAIVT